MFNPLACTTTTLHSDAPGTEVPWLENGLIGKEMSDASRALDQPDYEGASSFGGEVGGRDAREPGLSVGKGFVSHRQP